MYFENVTAPLSNHVPAGASQPVSGYSISEELVRSIKAETLDARGQQRGREWENQQPRVG